MNIGEQFEVQDIFAISEILSASPARYNGITDTYDICVPEQATCDIIVTKSSTIVIMKDCINRDALIDIL